MSPQNFHNLILCGDFNIDPRHSPNEYLTLLETDFQLTQIVAESTRVTDSSASMIDLVFLSNTNSLVSCDILASLGPSDHYTVQVSLRLRQHLKNS